jgi:hypothetical protein
MHKVGTPNSVERVFGVWFSACRVRIKKQRGGRRDVSYPDPISPDPDPDWAAANPQRSAQTATDMLILDILDIVVGDLELRGVELKERWGECARVSPYEEVLLLMDVCPSVVRAAVRRTAGRGRWRAGTKGRLSLGRVFACDTQKRENFERLKTA